MSLPEGIEKVLIDENSIKNRVRELGELLTREYQGKDPVFIGVLKGSAVFLSDLIREIRCPLEVDFCRVSSYRDSKSSGKIEFLGDIRTDISDRYVVLTEDIVDTAKTLSVLKAEFYKRGPREIKVAALLDKPSRREVAGFEVDYEGFRIDDHFVVGYGMDCAEKYRNLPYVGVYKG